VENPAQNRLRELSDSLTKGAIDKIEVLQIPRNILTRTRVTPEMLERQYRYRLTIQHASEFRSKDKMADAIKNTTVDLENRSPDLRCAIIFYSVDGKRTGAVYLDGTGGKGFVDDVAVSALRTPLPFTKQQKSGVAQSADKSVIWVMTRERLCL
jgi:hypothetical protein